MTLRRVAGFRSYWSAATVSSFGSAVSAVAVPVLVVTVLHAEPFEVGLVNAAQFLPYAIFGLVVGAYVDRFRRKPLLIWSSVGRGLSLAVIPVSGRSECSISGSRPARCSCSASCPSSASPRPSRSCRGSCPDRCS